MGILKINHAAVWVSIILLHVLGFLWYGPLFGEPWMKMVNLDPETIAAAPPSAGIWVTNTVSTVVSVYGLAWLFTKLKVETLIMGAALGLFISFCFNHMPGMSGGMFAKNPYGLAWITGGFNMTGMALTGLILGAWRRYVPVAS